MIQETPSFLELDSDAEGEIEIDRNRNAATPSLQPSR